MTYGGGSIKKIGLYDKVRELLTEFEVFELSGIEPNPKYSTSVVDGVRIFDILPSLKWWDSYG